jgi:subtilisin family serine protease
VRSVGDGGRKDAIAYAATAGDFWHISHWRVSRQSLRLVNESVGNRLGKELIIGEEKFSPGDIHAMMIQPNSFPNPASRASAPTTPALGTEQQPSVPSDSAELSSSESSAPYRPGELIIRTKPSLSLFAAGGKQPSVVDDLGATVVTKFATPGGIHKSNGSEFLHVKLPEGVSVEEALAKMTGDARVEFAVPNTIYTLPEFQKSGGSISNDPDSSKLWGLNNEGQTGGTADADIDAPEAWAVHTGRNQAEGGPIIAVIDTGIDYNHPDLKPNMWTNPGEVPGDGIDNDGNGVIDDVHGYNAIGDNGDPMDTQGHGSHCAGTIAAAGNDGNGVVGVNHKASLMAVRIFGDDGSSDAAAIIKAIQYADANGARITSNSWGGPVPNAGIKQAFADSSAFHLVAAGNSAFNNDYLPSFPANHNLPNLLSVAATDHNDGLAEFSQYGKKKVHLGAPGVDILSTVPGGKYDTYSGTSMATPHVSGAAGLIASAYPEISNDELRARLLGGVDQVPALDGKTVTGGRLNVHKSLTMEAPKGSPVDRPAGDDLWESIFEKIGQLG